MITIDRASIQSQYRKCSSKYCTTCKSGQRHGPYYVAFKTYKRRVFSMYIGKTLPADMQLVYSKLAAKIERAMSKVEK